MAGMDDKPTLKELVTHVNVGVEWMTLGVHLELDMKELDAIDRVKPAIPDKLQQMYSKWLTSKTGATRRQLLDALGIMDLNVLAEEYKEWIRATFSKRPITRHMASSKVKSKPGRLLVIQNVKMINELPFWVLSGAHLFQMMFGLTAVQHVFTCSARSEA